MFDHSADKIILIRINSYGAKEKDRESSEAIYATLFDVDIYHKDSKLTKSVGQCNNSVGGGVTEYESAGLSDVRQQDDAVYYVSACVLHTASKWLQNSMEKTFGESGMG